MASKAGGGSSSGYVLSRRSSSIVLTASQEGVLTFILAIVGYFALVDFPEEAQNSWKFLTPEEAELMIERVDNDRRDAHVTPFSLSFYLRQALDWKIWLYAANFGLSGLVSYAASYFLPTVLKESLGFSTVASLMLPAPVSFAAKALANADPLTF